MKTLTAKQIKQIQEVAELLYKKAVKYGKLWDFYELTGMCGITSGWVLDALNDLKIKSYALYNNNKNNNDEGHIFVVVNDEYILDITYRQFNNKHKSFLFAKKKDAVKIHPDKDTWFWNLKGKKITNKKELIKKQIKDSWPEEQIAF